MVQGQVIAPKGSLRVHLHRQLVVLALNRCREDQIVCHRAVLRGCIYIQAYSYMPWENFTQLPTCRAEDLPQKPVPHLSFR